MNGLTALMDEVRQRRRARKIFSEMKDCEAGALSAEEFSD
jgi:hypothetical protein